MTLIKLNNALKTSLPFLGKGRWIGLLFFFLSQISFAQSNSKQVYDLNDPRNPDCPCHKYQKMADDEFKKEYFSGLNHSARAKKRKKWFSLIHKQVKFFAIKPVKTKKFKPRYEVCYKW